MENEIDWSNKEEVMEAIREDSIYALENMDKKFRADKDVMISAIIRNPDAIKCTSKELWEDEEFVVFVLPRYNNVMPLVSEKLLGDKNFILKAAELSKDNVLEYASDEIKSDKEIVLEVVSKRKTGELQFASEELRSDKEFLLEVVGKGKALNGVLQYADDSLKEDGKFILQIVDKISEISNKIGHIDTAEMVADGMLDMLKKDTSKKLWEEDREFVLGIVERIGKNKHIEMYRLFADELISEKFRNDPEIMLEAIKAGTGLLDDIMKYASNDLKNNREFLIETIKCTDERGNNPVLQYASDELRGDRDVIRTSKTGLFYASDELKSDRDFVMEMIERYPYNFKAASEDLRCDREVVLATLRLEPELFSDIDPILQRDKVVVETALEASEIQMSKLFEKQQNGKQVEVWQVKRATEIEIKLKNLYDELKKEEQEKKGDNADIDNMSVEELLEYEKQQDEEITKTDEEIERLKVLQRVKEKARIARQKREERDALLRGETPIENTENKELDDNEEQL